MALKFKQHSSINGHNVTNVLFQVGMLSKYRTPEDAGVFQVIALSVMGLIVVLVTLVIMLRSIANMILYQDSSG